MIIVYSNINVNSSICMKQTREKLPNKLLSFDFMFNLEQNRNICQKRASKQTKQESYAN